MIDFAAALALTCPFHTTDQDKPTAGGEGSAIDTGNSRKKEVTILALLFGFSLAGLLASLAYILYYKQQHHLQEEPTGASPPRDHPENAANIELGPVTSS